MPEFTIQPHGYALLRKQAYLRTGLSLGAVILLQLWIQRDDLQHIGDGGELLLLAPVGIMVLLIAFVVLRIHNKLRKQFKSFRIIIEDEVIVRELDGLNEFRAHKSDIQSIERHPSGAIVVKTPKGKMGIPRGVGPEPELVAALQTLAPVTDHKPNLFLRYPMLLSLVMLGLLAVYYAAPNTYAKAAAGLAMAGVLIWSFVAMQLNINVTGRQKLVAWFSLAGALFFIWQIAKLLGIEINLFPSIFN